MPAKKSIKPLRKAKKLEATKPLTQPWAPGGTSGPKKF